MAKLENHTGQEQLNGRGGTVVAAIGGATRAHCKTHYEQYIQSKRAARVRLQLYIHN